MLLQRGSGSGTRRILYTPCNERDLYLAFSCLNADLGAKALPIDKPLWQVSFPHLAKLLGNGICQGMFLNSVKKPHSHFIVYNEMPGLVTFFEFIFDN